MKKLAAPRITRIALSLGALTALSALAGCADPPPLAGDTAIDLALFVDDSDAGRARLQGIASDPTSDDVHVLIEGRGLLQIDKDGVLVAERAVGVNGLEDRPYRDVAVIGDGRFLFIADNEGYLWDELAQTQKIHFCVEPGFVDCTDENGEWKDADNDGLCDWQDEEPTEPQPVEPDPIGREITQKNDALALTGSAILAAPRFYEDGDQIEASLRTYNVATGDPTGSADLTGLGLDLAGIDVDGDTLVGVSGSRLSRFTLAGERIAETSLDLDDGAGLIVDGDAALVLDRQSRSVVRYDIAEIK